MRRVLPLLLPLALATTGCGPEISVTGFDLSMMFPGGADHFWKYTHDDDAEVAYMVTEGLTAPAGEDWNTYTFYFGEQQPLIEAFAEDRSGWDHWAAKLYFADRADGWYFMGWESNATVLDIGSIFMDEDGLPFAVGNVFNDSSWTGSGGGMAWTVATTGRIQEPLQFNGQDITSAWHLTVASDAGDTPLEGEWWIAQGTGVVQFDVSGLEQGELSPWQHQHNDQLSNITGVPN